MRLAHGLLQPSRRPQVHVGQKGQPRQAMVFQRPVLLRRSALANLTYTLKINGSASPPSVAPLAHGGAGALSALPPWPNARQECCPAANSSAWRWPGPG